MSKDYTNRPSASSTLRNFYSPGYSSITTSLFHQNFSLRFYRCIEKNNNDIMHPYYYDLKNGITTTIDYEGASCLYQVAMLILEGINPEGEIRAVLECNNAALIFEYKRDQDNQMAAYLTIEKNNQSIPFRFRAISLRVQENGKTVTRIIQSVLGAFAKTLDGYLTGIGADLHLNKLPDNYENTQEENLQAPNPTTVNNAYPQGNYNSYASL